MFVCVVFPFILDVRIMVDPEVEFCVLKRATLMGTKNLYENGANPFFFGFLNLMGTRMIQIRIGKSVRAFRNKITNGFDPFNDWGGGDVTNMSPFWEGTARK